MAKQSNRSNLWVPVQMHQACRLEDLDGWVYEEVGAVKETAVRKVVREVASNLDVFVRWAQRTDGPMLRHRTGQRSEGRRQGEEGGNEEPLAERVDHIKDRC